MGLCGIGLLFGSPSGVGLAMKRQKHRLELPAAGVKKPRVPNGREGTEALLSRVYVRPGTENRRVPPRSVRAQELVAEHRASLGGHERDGGLVDSGEFEILDLSGMEVVGLMDMAEAPLSTEEPQAEAPSVDAPGAWREEVLVGADGSRQYSSQLLGDLMEALMVSGPSTPNAPVSPGPSFPSTQGGHDQRVCPVAAEPMEEALETLEGIDGFVGAALGGLDGVLWAERGHQGLEAEVLANAEVLRAQMRALSVLGLDDAVEDILVSLCNRYHLIRPVGSKPSLFFYLVLERDSANLALARMTLSVAAAHLD